MSTLFRSLPTRVQSFLGLRPSHVDDGLYDPLPSDEDSPTTTPLLPSLSGHMPSKRRRCSPCPPHPYISLAFGLVGMIAGLAALAILVQKRIPPATSPHTQLAGATTIMTTTTVMLPSPEPSNSAVDAIGSTSPSESQIPAGDPSSDPILAAQAHVAALRARQPSTYAHAVARYSLKTGRSPPRNYDLWFQFATEHNCLIDEYDPIYADFKPFYQLAEEDPVFFQRMIDRVSTMMESDNKEMARFEIRNGKVIRPEGKPTSYWDTFPLTLGWFAHILPDLTVILNGKDEPRVVFDVRQPGRAIRERALKLTEQDPFSVSPHPTSTYFYQHPGCTIMRSPEGFAEIANDDSAFFLSSAKTQWTEDLYPILSMTKVSPCFSDILFPIEYHYYRSWWHRKFAYPNNIEWKDKQERIYWRGTASGGQIFDDNWRNFTRFQLMDISRAHPDDVDAAITTFADELCLGRPECHKDAIVDEYHITGSLTPKENAYQYKYLLDVDGMSFSGRFLGLLRTGSLVFKMTVFEEYFNSWLRPYEHYIPVAPDLSDLLEKVEWAREHDAEARMIQERGKLVAETVVTDGQNDCYFSLVLLEWARLQEIARNAPARSM